MYDFVLFDGGVKKLPRAHQYFGIKAAQGFVRQKRGGIIWHTQGSGKSIVNAPAGEGNNRPLGRVGVARRSRLGEDSVVVQLGSNTPAFSRTKPSITYTTQRRSRLAGFVWRVKLVASVIPPGRSTHPARGP